MEAGRAGNGYHARAQREEYKVMESIVGAGTPPQIVAAMEEWVGRHPGPVVIAVVGASGSGKSALINAMLSRAPGARGAARTGVDETTTQATSYRGTVLPASGLAFHGVVLRDHPGAGGVRIEPAQEEAYWDKYRLGEADAIVVVCKGSYPDHDMWLLERAEREGILSFYVRTAADALHTKACRSRPGQSPERTTELCKQAAHNRIRQRPDLKGRTRSEEATLDEQWERRKRVDDKLHDAAGAGHCQRLFIVSNRGPTARDPVDYRCLFEMGALQRTLLGSLEVQEERRREALAHALRHFSNVVLEHQTRTALKWARVCNSAAAVSLLPVPLLDAGVDYVVLRHFMRRVRSLFKLDGEALLAWQARRTNRMHAPAATAFSAMFHAAEAGTVVVSAVGGGVTLAVSVAVPVVGGVIMSAANLAYLNTATTKIVRTTFNAAREVHREAERMLREGRRPAAAGAPATPARARAPAPLASGTARRRASAATVAARAPAPSRAPSPPASRSIQLTPLLPGRRTTP